MKNYEQTKQEFYEKTDHLKEKLVEMQAQGFVKTDQAIKEIKNDLWHMEIQLQQLPDKGKVKWELFKKEMRDKIEKLKKEIDNFSK